MVYGISSSEKGTVEMHQSFWGYLSHYHNGALPLYWETDTDNSHNSLPVMLVWSFPPWLFFSSA